MPYTKKVDRMGVMVLVSHLIITLAMMALYGVFSYFGKEVGTIENMLLVIVGYWFGAIGTNAIRPSSHTQIDSPEKVEIVEREGTKATIGKDDVK